VRRHLRTARARAAVSAGVLLACPALLQAAPPSVRFVTPTDVTPRSFQIVWLAGEPSTATLRLFEAPDCVNEVGTAEITPFPTAGDGSAIVPAARARGVMSVRAAGLAPDTAYCVQTVTTSIASGEVAIGPDPPLVVRTEKRTTRARAATAAPAEVAFSNDLVKLTITATDPTGPTTGTLVLVKVKGASSPLSAFVGDGVDDDGNPATPTLLALVNLNNLYDAASGESLDLQGDGSEDLSARVLGRSDGFVSVHARIIPAEKGTSAVVAPAPCRQSEATACDGRLGDASADKAITAADAEALRDLVVGLQPVLPCMVCGDATWDLTDDMKDALAIGQAVSGLRGLPW
jgi:hypothetical protein